MTSTAQRLYVWRRRACVDALQYLQWTTIGPAVGGLDILTRRINDNNPVAWYGTPWSGQPVKWNCFTSRTSLKPLCENKNKHPQNTWAPEKQLFTFSAITVAPKSIWTLKVTLMTRYHCKMHKHILQAKDYFKKWLHSSTNNYQIDCYKSMCVNKSDVCEKMQIQTLHQMFTRVQILCVATVYGVHEKIKGISFRATEY